MFGDDDLLDHIDPKQLDAIEKQHINENTIQEMCLEVFLQQ